MSDKLEKIIEELQLLYWLDDITAVSNEDNNNGE